MKHLYSCRLANIMIWIIIACCTTFSTCRTSDKEQNAANTVIVDSLRHIELTLPDSISDLDVMHAQAAISDYFSESSRYYIDTVSKFSESSREFSRKANNLSNKLVKVLPKFSITTGLDENRFTREYYVVEGDIKVERDDLLAYCRKRLQKRDTSIFQRMNSRKLTVASDGNGRGSVWPIGSVVKYCIARSSFASQAIYLEVVELMRLATNEWMKTCNIKFEHASHLDRIRVDLQSNPEPQLFIVRQINANAAFLAQAFYPGDQIFDRFLLIDNSFFASPYNKQGVLRHELGHVLGFRHEHIWSDSESCRGETEIDGEMGAIQVTKYDPYSVMHYPCGLNTNNFSIELTQFDREGALKVYPFPRKVIP